MNFGRARHWKVSEAIRILLAKGDHMVLFKKHLRPEELGSMLYEALRRGLESDGDLSLQRLVQSLELESEQLHPQYAGEVMIGLMYAATLAIERSTPQRVAQMIGTGMKVEFSNHLREQGASPLQIAEWEATVASTFLQYRTCLEDYSGFEPPWKLGRQLFWNLLDRKEYVAMSIKIATLYLVAARDAVQGLLNTHGPVLLIPPSSGNA